MLKSLRRLASTVSIIQVPYERASIVKATPLSKPIYVPLSWLIPKEGGGASSLSEQTVALEPSIFAHPIRRDILHLCVVHYLDSLRQGTASTKTRSEVRGSGAKIRPQKGSGRARLGDGQSPMLRGGGIAFGPKPRDFSTKLPRKVIQMGMRVALSAKVKEGNFGVVESLHWPGLKTNPLRRRIHELGWTKTLFITGLDTIPEGLKRSSDNIPKVDTRKASELHVYDILKWPRVILDLEAIDWFERKLSKGTQINEAEDALSLLQETKSLRFGKAMAGRKVLPGRRRGSAVAKFPISNPTPAFITSTQNAAPAVKNQSHA